MNDCPRQNPAYGRLFLSLYKSISYNYYSQVGSDAHASFALAGKKSRKTSAVAVWRRKIDVLSRK